MPATKKQPLPLGRPRDPTADLSILDAARSLFAREGYGSVTMDAVAAAAGVGKQTIYRRWASKAELAIDAIRESAAAATAESADFEHYALDMAQVFRATSTTLRALMAEAQLDPAVRALFRDRLIEPRRCALAAFLARELPGASAAVIDSRSAAIAGAFWYRLLLDEEMGDDFVRSLVRLVSTPITGA
jgi:AcrR family transcriptional regulator